jgi:hypothetical protein
MHADFLNIIEVLQPSFERLMALPPVNFSTIPKNIPLSGIYLFSEFGRHLYVGRSNNLRVRLKNHGRAGATEKHAAFAFRLARESTGNLKASYRSEGSRGKLMEQPNFQAAFESAKTRIREMEIRFVEEPDPLRQAVLEMYVAVALKAKYNDFDNH